MPSRYSQNFTLADIFNNKNLAGKLPLINYKEKERDDGKISRTTNAKTVNRQVFDTAKSAARPFYKPLVASQSGDTLILSGTLIGDQDAAVDAVYNALVGIRQVLVFTANNADMIRDALKESEKNKRKHGLSGKLFLRAQSMQEIEGMSKQQYIQLINNIMENIVYGDDFPATQKKWNVQDMKVNSPFSYEERRERWKQRVGLI